LRCPCANQPSSLPVGWFVKFPQSRTVWRTDVRTNGRCAKKVTVSQADFLNSGDRITSPAPTGRFYKFGGGIVRSFLQYEPFSLNITAFQNSPKPKITVAAGSQ
jgi:hypothetical protein